MARGLPIVVTGAPPLREIRVEEVTGENERTSDRGTGQAHGKRRAGRMRCGAAGLGEPASTSCPLRRSAFALKLFVEQHGDALALNGLLDGLGAARM